MNGEPISENTSDDQDIQINTESECVKISDRPLQHLVFVFVVCGFIDNDNMNNTMV